jgi:hypothetical protein
VSRLGRVAGIGRLSATLEPAHDDDGRRHLMSKTGRKRRARRKNKANHGKRPNT